MEQTYKIANFILESLIHIWPYLLITIPIAVGVKLSGAAKYINTALSKSPYIAIILATAVGALSPFCSCGVIPVIASLLIGGVPLAPVMSFWIASPSMDPEIFMLSVATIGWKLSVWRLSATFVISIVAGFVTLFVQKAGLLKGEILKHNNTSCSNQQKGLVTKFTDNIKLDLSFLWLEKTRRLQFVKLIKLRNDQGKQCCNIPVETIKIVEKNSCQTKQSCCGANSEKEVKKEKITSQEILKETLDATWLVVKFMALAFFINALIKFYVPSDAIVGVLGVDSVWSVLWASLIGIPFYTSNLTALPMVNGLISLGMQEGAALAFLIAGPTTTLPAMMAVWGIVKPRVFYLYLMFSLVGAVLVGYSYNLLN